jgi:hypothetical protein
MAISIKIGKASEDVSEEAQEGTTAPSISMDLDIRRTMDGNLTISDHHDVDIVVVLAKKKLVLFPKEIINDLVYDTQNRFFRYMRKKGIVDPDSVRGGNSYGSMEGNLLGGPEQEENFLPLVVLNISKFIDEERPYFEYIEKYNQMEEDEFLDPDPADSTELGEVPQAGEKGGIRPGYGRVSPYFLSYML